MDFEDWARRVSQLDLFELAEERAALDRDSVGLENEILGLLASSTRETVTPNWRLRRNLRRIVRREHQRKREAVVRWREFLIREGLERIEDPEEAHRRFEEVNAA